MDVETLILGGGVAGLAAAAELGDSCAVLEKESRPGGLVRSEQFGDYWFDRVLHLLYFRHEPTERRIREIVGPCLRPCPPRATVAVEHGETAFPFQTNLFSLEPEARRQAVEGFLAARARGGTQAGNYEDLLRSAFGEAMCEMFFVPYNRKMWQRELTELSTTGFTWNIAQPRVQEVLDGALNPLGGKEPYNQNGWYPRPEAGSSVRGMEALTQAIARQVKNLSLNEEVIQIDSGRRTVTTTSGTHQFERIISTLPLPLTVNACKDAPCCLLTRLEDLEWNSVISVALSIKGPRPPSPGLWRYYPTPATRFTRLIYMAELDPLSAPADGWGLLAEAPCRPELVASELPGIAERIEWEARSVGAIPPDCRVVDANTIVAKTAYVVHTPKSEEARTAALQFLRDNGIEPLGRYGRWEYSSMAQVIQDGFELAQGIRSSGGIP